MSREKRGPRGPHDGEALPPAARLAMRGLYAPPPEGPYWDGLEARVLARVRLARGVAGDDWSSVLVGWARFGIAAAAIAAAAAGIALVQMQRESHRQEAVAFATLMDGPSSEPAVAAATTHDGARAREATLEYLITH